MIALGRFAILIVAMVAIPWLATNPPRWTGWDSGWVQAWGSIGAILVGFGYVAFQSYLSTRDRRAAVSANQLYVLRILDLIDETMSEHIQMWDRAIATGARIQRRGTSTPVDTLGSELIGINPSDIGGPDFCILAKRAGLYARGFVYQSTIEEDGTVLGSTADTMKRLRDRFRLTAGEMRRMAQQ